MSLITRKESLLNIADAIRDKTGKTAALTYPDEFISEIKSIEAGSTEPAKEDEVNFWDYDGTLLYSYSLFDVESLIGLPALPEHYGLKAIGWNIVGTSEQEKLYNLHAAIANGLQRADIGAIYEPDDNNIHIDLDFQLNDKGNYVKLVFSNVEALGQGTPYITIDWGETEGAVKEYSDFSDVSYEYTEGLADNRTSFEVIITPHNIKSMSFGDIDNGKCFITDYNGIFTDESAAAVTNICLNSTVSMIDARKCINLKKVNLSPSTDLIPPNAFDGCHSLRHINLPANIRIVKGYAFRNNYSLEHFSAPLYEQPDYTIYNECVFYGCTSLKAICDVPYNNYQFYNCQSLREACYRGYSCDVGDSTFCDCRSLSYIQFESISIKFGVSALENCYSLRNDIFDNISIYSVNSKSFYYASNLRTLLISNSIKEIPANLCRYCSSLTTVEISGDITSLGDMCFNQCFHLTEIRMPNITTVPTIPNSYSIQHSKTFAIYVPAALVDEMKAATNWSGLSYYIKAIEEGDGND